MMIESNRQVNFEPISERICKMTIKLNSRRAILSSLASTLSTSNKIPEYV